MLNDESKLRILENFHSIDYVLFGKLSSKLTECDSELNEEYVSVKGALLSIVVEMYKLIDHSPMSLTERVDRPILLSNARSSAKLARLNCQKLVSTNQGRNEIKMELKESLSNNPDINISELVAEKIRLKSYSLAIDNLLVARAITESHDFKKLNEWEGKIIEDAYKVLRDDLVEKALQIIKDNEYAQ